MSSSSDFGLTSSTSNFTSVKSPVYEHLSVSNKDPNTYWFPFDCCCNNHYSLQRDNILTDAVITYDGHSFHCHSFVVSAFSSVLKEKVLESTTIEFLLLPFLTDPDIFVSILCTLYGQSVTVTTDNFPMMTIIASLLQFHELSEFVTERMTKRF
ncbi:hypothetical protein GEMRC1_001223 [Eukaryota sp. GEM-RC1]